MNGFIRRCDAIFIAFCFWVHACNSGASQQLVYSAEQIPSLPLVSRDDLPSFGTYWLLVGPANGRLTPPLPCPPGDMPDAPIYALGDGKFLVDDSAVDYQAKREQQAASELVQAIFGLDQAEDSQMRLYTSEELWLELACVTNGAVSFVLHPPDVELQSGVYDLFQTTNLTTLVDGLNATNWVCIARTSPGVTNISVPTLTPDASYFRLAYTNDTDSDGLTDAFEALSSHSDPNDVDSDGDGMPDGWEWRNFGSFAQTDIGDYDGDGDLNLDEYAMHTDPNSINFIIRSSHDAERGNSVPLTIQVLTGVPSRQAVATNINMFESVTWTAFSTEPNVAFGDSNGWHTVWIGLRGLSPDFPPEWKSARVQLDNVAPSISITNLPPQGVATDRMIQVQGYTDEPLSRLTYDIENDYVIRSNCLGIITGQSLSQAPTRLHTNYFQLYDVELLEGTNILTLRAVDRAGNVASTNIVFFYNSSGNTNAPSLTVIWPRDRALLGNSSITCFGHVNYPSAEVTAVIEDPLGTTNTSFGRVHRDGTFWFSDLPVVRGTNIIRLVATNPAGICSTTNITLIRSSVDIAILPVQSELLNQRTIILNGTISDQGYTIYVNGIQAEENNGAWTASNVPLDPGEIAAAIIEALPSGGTGATVQHALLQSRPDRFSPVSYGYNESFEAVPASGQPLPTETPIKANSALRWLDNAPGSYDSRMEWESGGWQSNEGQWPAAWWPLMAVGTNVSTFSNPIWNSTNTISGSIDYEKWNSETLSPQDGGVWSRHETRSASTGLKFKAGYRTPPVPGNISLYVLSATVTDYGSDGTAPSTAVAPEEIQLGGVRLNSSGKAFIGWADGAEADLTPAVEGKKNIRFTVTPPERHDLCISWNEDVTGSNIITWVGKKIALECSLLSPPGAAPLTISNFQWTVPGAIADMYVSPGTDPTNGFPVPLTVTNFNDVIFAWAEGGRRIVTCSAEAAGVKLKAQSSFVVRKPTARLEAVVNGTVRVDNGRLAFASSAFSAISFIAREPVGEGRWEFLQVGSQVYRFQDPMTQLWHRCGGAGFDGSYPGISSDSPYSELPYGGCRATSDGSFTTYLAFRPSDADILVPIRQIKWLWKGEAATNSAGNWYLVWGSNRVDASDSPAPSTLSWTNNITTLLKVYTEE